MLHATKLLLMERIGAIVVAVLLGAGGVLAADTDFEKKTFTYKRVGETEIQADVYRSAGRQVRPTLVWIHGGALLFGGRQDVPRNLLDLCRTEGFVLVSLDYRLAPEVKLPAIVEDIQDAFRWLRAEGPKQFAADADRVVTAGASAGGYLALVTGFRAEPRPKAIVSYWGFGDVASDWLTTPSAFFRKNVPQRTKEEAYRAVGQGVLTNTEGNPRNNSRVQFFFYLRQHALWPLEVTGIDPKAESMKLDPYCPLRNVTAAYPPTLLIHGTADNDVPVSASEAMAAQLAQHKVAHELITIPGAGHGLGKGDKKKVADAHACALAFIREHLK
jgi:acetyl esterase/lipase